MTEKQKAAWEESVAALRQLFLKGNSHIYNVEKWVDGEVIKAIETIRKTPKSTETKDFVEKIGWRESLNR